MAHSVGEVVEVLDASSGWLPARVLRRHEDGAYDVSVNLDETIHLGDAAACLSLLCAGDQESKIRAALGFYLDQSKTSLTLPALRAYLTSIFKVVFEARNFSDEERTKKPSPRSTGDATARRCFEDYGLTENESIHVDDFVQWYVDTLSGNTTEKEDEDWTAEAIVEAAFKPTDAEQAFAYLAQYRDSRNQVSREAFAEAIRGMLSTESSSSLTSATDALFDAFDSDGNGTIDFAELGAGLSVLCGGDAEQRVRLAFSLFDLDGDGDHGAMMERGPHPARGGLISAHVTVYNPGRHDQKFRRPQSRGLWPLRAMWYRFYVRFWQPWCQPQLATARGTARRLSQPHVPRSSSFPAGAG